MKVNRASLFAFLFALLTLNIAFANEPPRPGEIEHLKQTGGYKSRLEKARALGNHVIDRDLLKRAINRAKTLAAPQTGASTSAGQSAPPTARTGLPTTGSPKIFALEIDFSDYPAYSVNTKDNLQSIIFGDGTVNGVLQNPFPYESLANFYKRASYGTLDLSSGMVLGIYHTNYPRSTVPLTGQGRESLIETALNYFQSQGVDFSQFDSANNGTIPYFIVLWTGPDNGWSNFWWGYKTNWSDTAFKIGGKSLVTYSWQWEYSHGSSYTGPFDPRVLLHETGHALGLPDYYDYDTTVGPNGGVGGLDMMDSCYGDHNAFSKWVLGWINPTVVASGSQQVTLNPSGSNPDAAVIWPNATSASLDSEFFIVQNRFRTGNDPATQVIGLSDGYDARAYPTDGMLIWHVDATLNSAGTDWSYDDSYTSHKLLKLMQADGLDRIENSSATADAAMYYEPGNSLGPLATPNSVNYLGVDTGVNVTNIQKSGQQMSATLSIDNPRVLATLVISKTGIGSGLVASTDGGINCGADCAQSYVKGTLVTLTAAAAPGSKFIGWTGGGCSGTGSCTLPATSDETVTAQFDTTLLLNEDFDPVISAIPAGWTKVINAGAAGWWFNYTNYNTTGGTGGNALGATSGAGPFDSELRTFAVDLSTYDSVGFEFKTSIENPNDTADVDISVNGSAGPWTNVWEHVGTFYGPQTVDLNLTSVAAGHNNVVVRFHHYGTGVWWVLDDIKLMASASPVDTTTTVTSDTNPSLLGQTVNLTATVLPSTSTGTVTFFDGSNSLGTGTLSNGTATLGTSALALGSHSITASYGGDSTHNGSTSSAYTQTVNGPAAQTITFNPLPNVTYGASPITLGATATSGLAVSYTVSGPATVSGSTLTITGAGLVTVTASQAGNSNYAAATPVPVSFTVNPAVLTVTANNAQRAFGEANPVFSYTITGFVSPDTTSVVSGTATETTTANSTSPAGTYPITFSTESLTAANYTFTYVNGTLTVNGGVAQTITFGGLPNVTYGASPIALGATATSGLAVSYTVSGPATVSGSTLTITGAGLVTVTASQAGNGNYAAATPVSQSFTVNPAVLTVTANNAQRAFGAANPAFGYTITGFVSPDTSSVVSGTATETTTANSTSPAGTYPITFSTESLTAANYTFTYVNGTLTVNGGVAQTITFNPLPNVTYGVSPINLGATASSGLAVSYTVSGPATVSGSTLTITGAGLVTVTASQAGNGNYAAATPVPQSFTVNKATATISIINLPVNAVLGGSFVPAFSYSGSGTPTESVISSTTTVCTVSGGAVNFVGAGTCTLTANATATANYAAASGTPQSFAVGSAASSISIANIPSNAQYGGGFWAAYSYSGTGKPAEWVTTSTPSICSVIGNYVGLVGVGTCTLTAHAAATSSSAAVNGAPQSFAVSKATPAIRIVNIPFDPDFGDSFVVAYGYAGNGKPAFSVTSSTAAVCAVSSNIVKFVGVGTCTLTPSATATANYTAVTGAPQSFAVGKATPMIYISNIPTNPVHGGSFVPALYYSGNGTPVESVTSFSPSVCAVSGNSVRFLASGNCTLKASATSTANYNAVTGPSQSFRVK